MEMLLIEAGENDQEERRLYEWIFRMQQVSQALYDGE